MTYLKTNDADSSLSMWEKNNIVLGKKTSRGVPVIAHCLKDAFVDKDFGWIIHLMLQYDEHMMDKHT